MTAPRAPTILRYAGPPLALVVVAPLLMLDAKVPALAAAALLPLLLAESMVAELRGGARPRQVAWAAAWNLVPWGIAAVFLSWFVPLAAWLLAVGSISLLRPTPTAQGAVAGAWREATERFGQRRSALGRHYRWRVALAALPHLVYIFALSFLMLGVGIGLLGTAGLAAGSPETAVIGFLLGGLFTLLAVVVALPAAFGLLGVVLAPVVRRPFASLLRALIGLDPDRPSARRGCSAAVLVLLLDLALYTVAFGWAGVTFIGSAFPAGGSVGASFALVVLGAAVGLRVLVADALVLEGDHAAGAPTRVLRAASNGPLQLVELALWQITVVGLVFILPLITLAGVALALFVWKQPLWVFGAVSLAGLVIIARLGAAVLLQLALHRLTLLLQLAPAEAAPVPETANEA